MSHRKATLAGTALGRLAVGISGSAALVDAVADQVHVADLFQAGGYPLIQLEVGERARAQGRAALRLGHFELTQIWPPGEDGGASFVVRPAIKPYPGIPGFAFSALHPAFVTRSQYLAVAFVAQVLHPLAQLFSLRLGQSLLPASAVEKDGTRVAVIGRGGTGKSPMMLDMVGAGWRYLSDDMTTIEEDGKLNASHLVLSLRASEVDTIPGGSQRLADSLSTPSRVAWTIRERAGWTQGLRRYVSPTRFFLGEEIGRPGRLSAAYIVQRSEVRFPSVRDISSRHAASLVVDVIDRDILFLTAVTNHLRWTSPDEVRSMTQAILESGFRVTQCRIVEVPKEYSDVESAEVVARILLQD